MTFKLLSEDTVRSILFQRVGLHYSHKVSGHEMFTAGKVKAATFEKTSDTLILVLEDDDSAFYFGEDGDHRLELIELLDSSGDIYEILEDEGEEEEVILDSWLNNPDLPSVNIVINTAGDVSEEQVGAISSRQLWKLLHER